MPRGADHARAAGARALEVRPFCDLRSRDLVMARTLTLFALLSCCRADDNLSGLEGPMSMSVTVEYPECCTLKRTRAISTKWLRELRAATNAELTMLPTTDVIYISAPSQQYAEQIREHILTKPETVVVEEKLGKGAARRKNGPAMPQWRARKAREMFEDKDGPSEGSSRQKKRKGAKQRQPDEL